MPKRIIAFGNRFLMAGEFPGIDDAVLHLPNAYLARKKSW